MFSLRNIDPYKAPAGPETDAAIHQFLSGKPAQQDCPRYSSDLTEANKVKARLKSEYGLEVVTGRTRIAAKPWFARYETDPSTSTEVLAETCALAICRLALVRACREAD